MKTGMIQKWILVVTSCVTAGTWAVTPSELQALLDDGTSVTLVDIRTESFFRDGHIPNAINVPERVLARKKLPALGRVFVYGRGLGTEDIVGAVKLLNDKPGIQAEVLEGGYATWVTDRGTTTQKPGFQPERIDYVSYQDLATLSGDDVVLVDLRKAPEPEPGKLTRQGTAAAPPKLASLDENFPGRAVVRSPLEIGAVASRTSGTGELRRMSSNPEPVPVMVLIDSGDGEAEKMARMLRANGIFRVVVLAGGESILERKGASGLQRIGGGAQTLEAGDE